MTTLVKSGHTIWRYYEINRVAIEKLLLISDRQMNEDAYIDLFCYYNFLDDFLWSKHVNEM